MKLDSLHDGYDPNMSAQRRHSQTPPIKGTVSSPRKVRIKKKKEGNSPLKYDSAFGHAERGKRI